MNTIFLVIGVPGVGKTTLIREVLALFREEGKAVKRGLVFGSYYHRANTFLFGSYPPGEVFAGTDRCSMQLQKDVPMFWEWAKDHYPHTTFLGEGSRISTPSFIESALCHRLSVSIIRLVADPILLEIRRNQRSPQQPQWVKGMETRIQNLASTYSFCVQEWENTNTMHLSENTHRLYRLIKEGADA